MSDHWELHDARQSLILASSGGRLPSIVYWGPRLPEGADTATLARAQELDVTGGMIDRLPDLSICPEASSTFPGQPGLSVAEADGTPLRPAFMLEVVNATGSAIFVRASDAGLTYSAEIGIDPDTHMITARAAIEADRPVRLNWLSAPVFPAPQQATEMVDFSGRWIGEFQENRIPWSAGIRMRESLTGRTGHEHFPGLVLPCLGTTATRGHAYALHYGWSGGHRMLAEELPEGRRQVQFGNAAATELEPATRFETATLYATFSEAGENGCATAFQRHLRDKVVTWTHPGRPRPVHYNCWEAIYFDHNLADLTAIADRAAALGAERFVLDDGWFGTRDGDVAALGDWTVDPRKYPDGLGPLIDHIHGLGMSFGIWFEPEMVNPDSDLYRAHPEWALGAPDQTLGRQQMVLDMSLPEVREYLYDHMAAVLSAHEIDYIKWDHNRVLPYPDAAQTRGTYALLDRLRRDFPKTEIESCASGGGRIDFGILERTQRVWLSDSNDALERLRIQHAAARFLPAAVTGSHVGPRHCHTSGRVLDIRFRAWVAAQRHMGFEMDPRELTEEEEQVLRDVTAWWKDNRDWLMRADILRLDTVDDAMTAELQLAEDGSRFVTFAGVGTSTRQILPRPLQLTGLDPQASYEVTLRNRGEATGLSRGTPLLKTDPVTVSGQYLMHHGLTLPWSFPETMWVVEGTRQ